MKVLLTGSNGFIGRYLKKNLPYEIVAPTSAELDLCNLESVTSFLEKNKFDAVVHSAVKGREQVKDRNLAICDSNLWMFHNLAINRQQFKTLVNFGSGAEYGLNKSIDNVSEDDMLKVVPEEGYGLSKNIITRSIRNIPHFYNLRIFSCCDPSEDDARLVQKFKRTVDAGKVFVLDKDRYIDFFSLADINFVVQAAVEGEVQFNDINLVYQDKLKASDILHKYCKVNNVDPQLLRVTGVDNKNYTGNGNRLAQHNFKLEGLEATLAKYRGKDE